MRYLLLALLLVLAGCGKGSSSGDSAEAPIDGGGMEIVDGGTPDDVGPVDSGAEPDSGTHDAGAHDGGLGSRNSCPNVQASCQASAQQCTEYASEPVGTLPSLQMGCSTSGGSWRNLPCNVIGSIGGCKVLAHGTCYVSWLYPPVTAADGRMGCVANGGTWVTP